MKMINWNPEKSRSLEQERGICFEDVVIYIQAGEILDVLEHPNRAKYPDQFIYVMNIEGYVYLVSFVENEKEIFLKTVIPSRKATRDYLGGNSG